MIYWIFSVAINVSIYHLHQWNQQKDTEEEEEIEKEEEVEIEGEERYT